MKNARHTSTIDSMDNRMAVSHHRDVIPKSKLSSGSVAEKYPVVLDDGKTIIFISDRSKEREIRLRYALRRM